LAAFLACFFALAGLAASAFAGSTAFAASAFGASAFFSATTGAVTVAFTAGVAAGAGALVWANETEEKPAATSRAIIVLTILNLL
jgi:hypothetical protein